jgi:amicoumacin kinase
MIHNDERVLLKSAISLYNANTDKLLKQSGGYQNNIYQYNVGRNEQILRVTSSCHRNLEEIEGELHFINVLAKDDVSVSEPILSANGRYIEEISVDGQDYYLTSFRKAEGMQIDVGNTQVWNEELFRHWGRTLGRMHRISKNHGELKETSRPHWTGPDDETIIFLSSISNQAVSVYKDIINKVSQFHRAKDTYGLIHNDFHIGNFFVHEGKMTIFDFDDCSYSWFAQDIAVSIYHAIWQGMSFHPNHKKFPNVFIKSLLEGYRQENDLNKHLLIQVPLFLKLREVFLLKLFHQKWNFHNLEEWQQFTLVDLKYRIENNIPYLNINLKLLL